MNKIVEREIRRYRQQRERIELQIEKLRLEEQEAWERVYRFLDLDRLGEWHQENKSDS